MNLFFGVAVMFTMTVAAVAEDYVPGKHDAKAVQLLREMATSLPLQKTELEVVAPNCSVARIEGLTWEQAVAEANVRFGTLQPQRAAFLRKYLGRGSPESDLSELQLRDSGISVGTGSGTSRTLVHGYVMKPRMSITVWIAKEELNQEPTLVLEGVVVEGNEYCALHFDHQDRLFYSGRVLPALADGTVLSLTQGSQSTDGQFYYVAAIKGPNSESESVWLNPDFTLRERWVKVEKRHDYRELFEKGVLSSRKHYSTRQVAGGTETYVQREETFP